MWAGLDHNILRPLADSTHSQKGLILSLSRLCRLVIGGRLWLLSRAALPVLNKNFMLSGWWAQRSEPEHTHTQTYTQASQCKDLLQFRDLTLLHTLPILSHCDPCAVTPQLSSSCCCLLYSASLHRSALRKSSLFISETFLTDTSSASSLPLTSSV